MSTIPNQIQAVMVVLKMGDRFLMGKRSTSKAVGAGFWCPVSGRIEAGESEQEAVQREAWEEVGLRVHAERKLAEIDSRDHSVKLHFWLAEILSGEAYLKNDEHTELGWFTREELQNLRPSYHEDLAILLTLA